MYEILLESLGFVDFFPENYMSTRASQDFFKFPILQQYGKRQAK
jgi:hypothetical protein